jgi:CRISPR-associated protein Cmr3
VWLSFEALDVWFFRDGRPFDAGEAHRARSQFPPPPETMLGATRAILIEDRFGSPTQTGQTVEDFLDWLRGLKSLKPADLAAGPSDYVTALEEWGAGAHPGSQLALTGPFVVVDRGGKPEERVIVAAPRDLRQRKASSDLVTLNPRFASAATSPQPLPGVEWNRGRSVADRNGGMSDVPYAVPLISTVPETDDLDGAVWISVGSLASYLNGRTVQDARPPATSEARTGIAIGQDRVVRDRHFYVIEMTRPETAIGRTRLLASVEPSPVNGGSWTLPFGGEGKTALARSADADPEVQVLESLLNPTAADATNAQRLAASNGWMRVVLLQPAIFDRGWLPDGVNANGTLAIPPFTFSLHAAAVGKPIPVSGWDLRTNEAKPLRRAVPAGSVFFFRIEAQDASTRLDAAEAFWTKFHGKCALQDDPAVANVGYGLAVVGACVSEDPRL